MATSIEALEHFQRLRQEQENYLQICNEKIENWKKFKNDYLTLRSRLETLPHELKYEIMVPISKKAFMPGKLVNTNEILVLLGDNWFVEKSTKQACDLIDRRLVNIEKFMQDLDKEKNIITEQSKWTKDLIKEKGEYVNIEEKIDETQEMAKPKKKELSEEEKKELRKKQQERALKMTQDISNTIKEDIKSLYKAKEHRQDEKETEEEEENEEEENEESERKEVTFMEQLERDIEKMDLEEKFEVGEEETKLKEMMKDYEVNINRKNNELVEKALKEKLQSSKSSVSIENGGKKRVKWSDDTQESEENEEEESYDEDEEEYDEDDEEFTEEEEIAETKSVVIHIKHTKNDLLDNKERNRRLSRDKPEIDSPADIYTVFNKPKSILKKTSEQTLFEKPEIESKKNVKLKEEPKNAESEKFEPHKAFTGEIVERAVRREVISDASGVDQAEEQNGQTKKSVSKFKASKFSQRN